MAHIATLQEIELHYSLIDVLDANEALDLQMAADAEAMQHTLTQHNNCKEY